MVVMAVVEEEVEGGGVAALINPGNEEPLALAAMLFRPKEAWSKGAEPSDETPSICIIPC